MDESPVKVGDVLAQKYRVDRVLGVGGMGVVVEATHMQLDQRFAVKFMLQDAFKQPDALVRFQREAKAAVKLKSEHVARVHDTGTFENGSPYIVMEYLEGVDLSHELEQRRVFSIEMAADYMVQACDALAEAHQLGIVHRDLKPANLFLARRQDGSPLVKVLDFGISKTSALNDTGLAMTKTSAMMGSPLYMSPEQMRSSKDVDQRSDIWSLGIILYEMLGGRVPFTSDTLGGLLSTVMMDPAEPLQNIRPDLPADICAIVNHCMEKKSADRAQDVGEIALALRPYCPPRTQPIVDRILSVVGASAASVARTSITNMAQSARTAPPSGSTLSASTSSPALDATMAVHAQTAAGWGTTNAPQPKRGAPVALIVASLAVVCLVSVGAFIGLRNNKAPTSAAGVVSEVRTPPVTTPAVTARSTTPMDTTLTMAVDSLPPATVPSATPTPSAMPAVTTNSKPVAKPIASSKPMSTGAKPGILDTSN